MIPLEALSIMDQTANAFIAGKRPTLDECVLIKQALQVLAGALTPTSSMPMTLAKTEKGKK